MLSVLEKNLSKVSVIVIFTVFVRNVKYKLVKYKHTNSLWNWTTEDVLRPDKPETFQGLIEIMSEDGFLKPVECVAANFNCPKICVKFNL